MRRMRWILYDTTHGLLLPTGGPNIVGRFRTRGEAAKMRDLMFDDGDCVYLTYIPAKYAKPYTTERERPIDRALRSKFGKPRPIETAL